MDRFNANEGAVYSSFGGKISSLCGDDARGIGSLLLANGMSALATSEKSRKDSKKFTFGPELGEEEEEREEEEKREAESEDGGEREEEKGNEGGDGSLADFK